MDPAGLAAEAAHVANAADCLHLIKNNKYLVLGLSIFILMGSFVFYPPHLFAFSYVSDLVGLLSFSHNSILADAPRAWGLYFQDSASPQMEALVELHDNIMYYLVAILLAVGWIQAAIIRNFQSSRSPISNKYLNHGKKVCLFKSVLIN
jgi:hypothetical protein